MVGFIYQTMDWLMASASSGQDNKQSDTMMLGLDDIPDNRFHTGFKMQETWWKTIPSEVKHIHYYHQMVVYEKGVTHNPYSIKTVGKRIRYKYSGNHEKVNWKGIINGLDSIFGVGLL